MDTVDAGLSRTGVAPDRPAARAAGTALRKVRHGIVINGDLVTRCIFLRDYRGGREKAEALIALARENGFSYFEALGRFFWDKSQCKKGQSTKASKPMLEGMETLRAAGETLATTVGQ